MQNKSKNSGLEKISILIAFLFLVGIAIYFVSYVYTHNDIITEEPYATNVPITGEFVSVESVSTSWEKKGSSDIYYPVAVITLDPSESKSGAIRTIFRSNIGTYIEESKVIGDSETYSFTNGIFANGTNSIKVYCTKGLPDDASFLSYKAQDKYRWIVEVREGDSAKKGASNFTELATAPIEPIVTESE